MKISIITVFPEIFDSFFKISLIGKAIEKGLIEVNIVRFSDMVLSKERIDEPTCGPGVGMIIKPEVVEQAINICQDKWGIGFKIFFSPQGKKLDQRVFRSLSKKFWGNLEKDNNLTKEQNSSKFDHLILVCARYEGMDCRVEQYYADLLLSIGDFVVMGGDLPAQVFLEGLLRFLPGVVGKQESIEKESFSQSFLDYPAYGLPIKWKDLEIPEIVRSGNHAAIEEWRKIQAAKNTVLNRLDWFASTNPSEQDLSLVNKIIPNHYVALMHTQVLVKDDIVGCNSITSLDIHDISRSSATYGIKNYFLVTPLQDQQKVLNTFLNFWKSEEGKEYNISRFEAVSRVIPAFDLDDVLTKIEEKEGKKPLIITTSAKSFNDGSKPKVIDYFSQKEVFEQNRPILFIFGTAKGLCPEVLKKSDFLLLPIRGMTNYNHLSVRSAAAIILDRWLGLNEKLENNID